MSWEECYDTVIFLFCEYPYFVFSVVFAFAPYLLRVFTISMLILSIGRILDLFGRKWSKTVKWMVYIWFIFYSFWLIEILSNIEEGFTLLDYTTIMFGVIAPICMFIVGRFISTKKVKGHRIFNYWMWWLVYTIIAVVWWLFLPEIVFINFIFIYIFLSIFTVFIIEKFLRGIGYGKDS